MSQTRRLLWPLILGRVPLAVTLIAFSAVAQVTPKPPITKAKPSSEMKTQITVVAGLVAPVGTVRFLPFVKVRLPRVWRKSPKDAAAIENITPGEALEKLLLAIESGASRGLRTCRELWAFSWSF